jgi:quercetin dioxygenase-like cupin family protein
MPDDATVSLIGPADGEDIQLGPIRMRILTDGSSTGHRLGIGELTVPPGVSGPPQHRHAAHDETFYVLSGTVRFTVGEQDHDAPAGTLVVVPPGAPHTFANRSGQPAIMLNTFTPDAYVQYFRDMRDYFASGQPFDPATAAGIMRRYATEPATEFDH